MIDKQAYRLQCLDVPRICLRVHQLRCHHHHRSHQRDEHQAQCRHRHTSRRLHLRHDCSSCSQTLNKSFQTPQIQLPLSNETEEINRRLINFVSDSLPTDYTIPPTTSTYLAAIYNSADRFVYLLMMHGAILLPSSKLLPTNVPHRGHPHLTNLNLNFTLALSRCTVEV